jgi:hypothetical protein
MGKFFRYQYEAGAAMESDFPDNKFFKVARKAT